MLLPLNETSSRSVRPTPCPHASQGQHACEETLVSEAGFREWGGGGETVVGRQQRGLRLGSECLVRLGRHPACNAVGMCREGKENLSHRTTDAHESCWSLTSPPLVPGPAWPSASLRAESFRPAGLTLRGHIRGLPSRGGGGRHVLGRPVG